MSIYIILCILVLVLILLTPSKKKIKNDCPLGYFKIGETCYNNSIKNNSGHLIDLIEPIKHYQFD